MHHRSNLSSLNLKPKSMQSLVENEDGQGDLFINFIFDNNNETAQESLDKKIISDFLHSTLDSLRDIDAKIIKLKFFENKTNKEIGDIVGMSKERIRQKTIEILFKIKCEFIKNNIDDLEGVKLKYGDSHPANL